ncbi:MAG TPA: transcriptional repressor [Chloroflexia bacterium]|nr:transcriptional repressor [Chloroflexia bacterium]
MDNQRIAQYQEKLVASGVRLTPQRFMVREAIVAQPGHTTADQVLATVQTRYPHVNKTTVYRTLELLSDLGMVAITHMGGNQAAYELVEVPHHHLICKECGWLIDLPDATLNPLRELVEQEHGFRPCLDHFTLFGICRECRTEAAAGAE